jgi:CRISPR-associated protein Csd1
MSGIKEFPAAMNLEEQGKFVLGYYHQREYIYTKKEDKDKMAV